MYERSYGYLYDRDRSVKDDAGLIRATIKTLVGGGLLPADWKYAVRYRTASQMRAVDVVAKSPRPIWLMSPGDVWAAKERVRIVTVPAPRDLRGEIGGDWMQLRLQPGERYEIRYIDAATTEAAAVERTLLELHHACNHDGSDSQTDHFDVKFYGYPALDTLDGVPRAMRERPSHLPASAGGRR